jgi:predicted DNA-binding ribbon-helix-helix protein
LNNLQKKSFTLEGHQTSIALEPEFWATLMAIASENQQSLASLISQIDITRNNRPLASALRVYCLVNAARILPANNAQ